MNKITPFCERIFYALAAVSFFYLTAVALYWNRADPVAITLATICGLVLLAGLWRLSCSERFDAFAENGRQRRIAFWIISGLFLALCLVSALMQLENFPRADWDIWVIHSEAANIASAPFPERMRNAEYFYRFPQNGAILMLFTGWYRLWYLISGEAVDFNLAAAVLCALFLWVAHLLFYLAVRVLLGNRQALLCAMVWVLVLPFYGYAATPYSDSMSLPFCTGMLLCLAKLRQTKRPLWGVGAGVLAGLALRMKGTYAVLIVAALIWLVMLSLDGIRRKLAALAAFVICLGAVAWALPVFFAESGIWGRFSREYVKQEWQVPVTHYFMMAQNPDGPWVYEDNEFTFNLQQGKFTFEARTAICLQMCFDRIAARSPLENLLFTNRKVVETWKDGTLQVNQYDRDTFYWPDTPVREFFKPGTALYQVFYYCSNALHFAFLICLTAGAVRRLLQKGALLVDGIFFAHLCVFGMFLLELVWEWRSRYLFGYLPFFILAAPAGLEALQAGFARLRRGKGQSA